MEVPEGFTYKTEYRNDRQTILIYNPKGVKVGAIQEKPSGWLPAKFPDGPNSLPPISERFENPQKAVDWVLTP